MVSARRTCSGSTNRLVTRDRKSRIARLVTATTIHATTAIASTRKPTIAGPLKRVRPISPSRFSSCSTRSSPLVVRSYQGISGTRRYAVCVRASPRIFAPVRAE
jgi:hypothetical protein